MCGYISQGLNEPHLAAALIQSRSIKEASVKLQCFTGAAIVLNASLLGSTHANAHPAEPYTQL